MQILHGAWLYLSEYIVDFTKTRVILRRLIFDFAKTCVILRAFDFWLRENLRDFAAPLGGCFTGVFTPPTPVGVLTFSPNQKSFIYKKFFLAKKLNNQN